MTRTQQILDALGSNGAMTFAELRASLDIGRSNLSSLLAELVKDGKVLRTGTRRLYQYRAANRVPSSVFDLASFGRLRF